jgi:4-hydroxy-tetrahydrodipicolinate synthase
VNRVEETGEGELLVAAAAGEFPVLSIAERHAVIRASLRAAAGRVPVMTSIQHTDVREIVDLVRFCADEGVAGVQLGPTYYYPATEDDLFRLIDAVDAASTIPIMAYATWWDGGVVLAPRTLRRVAEYEHVHAVKWSAPDSGAYAAGIAAIADQ